MNLSSLSKLTSLQKLKSKLNPSLDRLSAFVQDQVTQFEPELQPIFEQQFAHQGKRLRSLLLFSCTEDPSRVSDDHIKAAAIIEFVHLATLLHDDVLDSAEIRHNLPTVAATYGNPTAILLGDTLFAYSLELASSYPTTEICQRISRCTRLLCSGEVIQTLRNRTQIAPPSVEDYWRVVSLKTGELFAASAYLGATLSRLPRDQVLLLERLALLLGSLYQLYDDLVDVFSSEQKTGKTLGTDFANQNWTLPFILYQEQFELSSLDPENIPQQLVQAGVVESLKEISIAKFDELGAILGKLDYFREDSGLFVAFLDHCFSNIFSQIPTH